MLAGVIEGAAEPELALAVALGAEESDEATEVELEFAGMLELEEASDGVVEASALGSNTSTPSP